MTKAKLAERLDHLDPGSTVQVEAQTLAEICGAGALTPEIVKAVEAFARSHRCSFSHEAPVRHPPTFEKDDIF